MMSDEMLGCPFCGCRNIHADWHYNENSDGGGRGIVTCAECGVEVTSADPGWMNCQADRDKCVSDAIAAWNRRVPAPAVPDDVAEQVARLREAYALVAEFPESKPDGFMNLLALRNLTPDAADTIEAQAAELARYREALQPFASAWKIEQASGLTGMSQLGPLARNEVAAVSFMKAAAALTQPTGDRT